LPPTLYAPEGLVFFFCASIERILIEKLSIGKDSISLEAHSHGVDDNEPTGSPFSRTRSGLSLPIEHNAVLIDSTRQD